MKKMMLRALGVVSSGLAAGMAFGQADWGIVCIDPMNMMPRTNPYSVQGVFNDLIYVNMGLGGSVTYGGASGPCFFDPQGAQTFPNTGRFAIGVGPLGSVQETSQGFEDAGLTYTFGAFTDPIGAFATTTRNGTRTHWGDGGFSEAFVGFSNRYMSATSTNDSVRARLQVEIVADAARFRWQLTNVGTEEANIGLWFGAAVSMLFQNSFASGHSRAPIPSKPLYVYLPNQRPPQTDVLYNKQLNPGTFPAYADFLFGQSDAIGGFRIEMEPSEATRDVPENQPADVSRFWLGKSGAPFPVSPGILGNLTNANIAFTAVLIPDTYFLTLPSYITEFPERAVAAGETIQILHYIRSTWGTSNYQLPYGVVVDAPKLLGTPTTNVNGQPNDGDVDPNPFPVRVYVDNVGGYGFDGREFPLNDVRVKLKFAADAGMTIQGASQTVPYELERTLPLVQPREDEFIDFTVTAGPNVVGVVPYTVEIFSQPGNVRKTINGSITVAARPRLTLYEDANFLTFPYEFTETSLETVLSEFLDPNVPGGDFQAYRWDPVQQGYVITNTVERGRGLWVIYDNTANTDVIGNLQGNPRLSGQDLNNADLIQGRGGFNMIGNPYNYPIPINQILGVSAASPQVSRTFREMIELGLVQSFLTKWDPVTNDYVFVDAESGFLEPLKGYWVRVLSDDDITFNYPDVYLPFVPEQTRKPKAWKQSESQWKLKLSARTSEGGDAENHVGQAANAAQARQMRIFEPPKAPNQKVALSIESMHDGKAVRMAQTLSETRGRHEWKVIVDAAKAGDVTITWPNLATLPKNVRLRITDRATNISRFLRQASGYTFRMDRPGTREFTLTAETSGSVGAVITNVIASQPVPKGSTRAAAPFTVAYTLSADATTSVRVLSGTGKEVFVIHNGRADRAGEHKVVWNLRTSSNRAVAPGSYRIEIVAETAGGERIRKVVPINVVR